MILYSEVIQGVGLASNPRERWLYFCALLARGAEVPGEDFTIVGGSAIELYTAGGYTTGDVDIVSSQAEKLKAVLGAWGFEREGRVWLNKQLGIVIDLVGHSYPGDPSRTQVLQTPFGSVRVAAIEDLIVKRLASVKHWGQRGYFEHAKLLGGLYRERID